MLSGISKEITVAQDNLESTKHSLEVAKKEVDKPFERLDELRELETRLETLNKELAEDADKP